MGESSRLCVLKCVLRCTAVVYMAVCDFTRELRTNCDDALCCLLWASILLCNCRILIESPLKCCSQTPKSTSRTSTQTVPPSLFAYLTTLAVRSCWTCRLRSPQRPRRSRPMIRQNSTRGRFGLRYARHMILWPVLSPYPTCSFLFCCACVCSCVHERVSALGWFHLPSCRCFLVLFSRPFRVKIYSESYVLTRCI